MWERPDLASQACEDVRPPRERPAQWQHGVKEGGRWWSAPVPWGPETWDPAVSEWRPEREQAGEQLMVGLGRDQVFVFCLAAFRYVDVSISAHGRWRLPCLLAAYVFWVSKRLAVFLPTIKKVYVCVWCVRCLCVGGCGWGCAVCALLLMSHDFPVFGALQNYCQMKWNV